MWMCVCCKCMEMGEQNRRCEHWRDEERGWHCNLNSVDLIAALENEGARVARCYEILCWNPAKIRTDLFENMIKSLIARKVSC